MRLQNGEVLLRWPLDQHILTQGWKYNNGNKHNGVDLRTQIGNTAVRPVYAAEDGTVSATQLWDGHTTDERSMQSYGNMVDVAPEHRSRPHHPGRCQGRVGQAVRRRCQGHRAGSVNERSKP